MMKVSDAFYSKNMDLIALFKACPDADLEHKHHYCGNDDCVDGIMLNNLSREEFYNKFIDD